MLLELTHKEAQELQQALDVYLAEMDFEVARTHKRDYRHGLVVDREVLLALRRRLEALTGREQPDVVGESH